MAYLVGERCKFLACLFLLVLLTGCAAGQASFKRGNQAVERQNYDEAVMEYLAALDSDPGNHQYLLKLDHARNKAALAHKARGDEYFSRQQYQDAVQEYQLAGDLDGSLFTAVDGVQKSRDYLKADALIKEAQTLLQSGRQAQAKDLVSQALERLPDYPPALQLRERIKQSRFALVDGVELDVISTEPINLNFRDAKLPDVFEILTKLSGINFILDEDVRGTKTTLFLEKATFAQALELLLRMNKLDKKILNSKTIVLYPKTRDKQKQFEDQVIQTFYLAHIDAKKAVNMLRTMLQVRKIYVQEDLNAIVIRDQPDVIKLARKMLEANDRGSSEVVFDLELLEVNHNDTRELGLKLSNYSVGIGLSEDGSGQIVNSGLESGGSTSGLIDSFSNLEPFYAIPSASFRLLKTLTDAEVLANPKIRVRNKEKAKVHVGSREPVVTVTINDTQTSENVQYIDVGVKLDVEPTIQLDQTIVTKLGLEVSNVSGRTSTSNGTAVITISSTTADTTLTLKDGEQTVIGGLIQDNKSVTKNKVPLLGDIPLLGEVFNGTDNTKSKREILLSITPHIVRQVHVPQGETASIWSGGEDDLKFGRNFGTFAEEYRAGQQSLEEPVELPEDAPLDLPETDAEMSGKTSGAVPDGLPQQGTDISTPDTGEQPASVQAAQAGPGTLPQPVEQPIIEEAVTGTPPGRPMVLVVGASQVPVGEDLTLSVVVENVRSLSSAPLSIHYDPAILEFVDAVEGPFLQQGSATTLFTYAEQQAEGRIITGLKLESGTQGVSGGGELFSLHFKPIAAGTTEVTPEQTAFRNGNSEIIRVDAIGLPVTVAVE